ncbi:ring-h2 finger protein atl54-like [Stylonychia lemnae]|uniref:Ring-h2 finger protein atl54-like n=1 Tax=Stylonychia lemnae TaxID=5949 RepID=A0A078ALY3_STYLE|nr:ring-h2 finger protein atl54-like [Stylonychia lemnae]|eukprot:CDW82412.1 ring-h2 finger protein atl54-like [Stylonychia lemnae]
MIQQVIHDDILEVQRRPDRRNPNAVNRNQVFPTVIQHRLSSNQLMRNSRNLREHRSGGRRLIQRNQNNSDQTQLREFSELGDHYRQRQRPSYSGLLVRRDIDLDSMYLQNEDIRNRVLYIQQLAEYGLSLQPNMSDASNLDIDLQLWMPVPVFSGPERSHLQSVISTINEKENRIRQNKLDRLMENLTMKGNFDIAFAEFEEEKCVVCLEQYKEIMIIRKINRCGHIFHSECLEKWVISQLNEPKCPLCNLTLELFHQNSFVYY